MTSDGRTTGAPSHPPVRHSPAGQRFGREIVRLHEHLNFRGLPDAVVGEPLFRLDSGSDGLVTVSVYEHQLPGRYLRAVLGFRLAQFLQLGWMDPDLALAGALYHEPVRSSPGPATVHTVTLTRTGRIVGYVGLVGTTDPLPLPLDAAQRQLFPAEVAHNVDLLSDFAALERTTHRVYEIKRFVRASWLPRGVQRDRVPWHLMLAMGRSSLACGTAPIQLVVGDSRENGALRHLRMLGVAPVVAAAARPQLPRTELMWPSYEQAEVARPFTAVVPDDVHRYLDVIEQAIAADPESNWRQQAVLDLLAVAA